MQPPGMPLNTNEEDEDCSPHTSLVGFLEVLGWVAFEPDPGLNGSSV